MALRKAALLFALVIPIACQEAGQVPLTVVNPLEPVEVEHQNRKRSGVALGAGVLLLEAAEEVVAQV